MTLQIATGPQVIEWTGTRLGIPSFGMAEGLGICRDGRLLAGIVYNNYNGSNVEMSIASIDPRWCSRQAIRIAFLYPFAQLGCRRVSATVATHNEAARRLLERLGFEVEGFHPKAMRDGADALSYGLLRENCHWISSKSSSADSSSRRRQRSGTSRSADT